MVFRIVLPVTLVFALAGCGAIGAIGLPWKRDRVTVTQTEPLPSSTAVGDVEATDLGPPGGTTTVDGVPTDGTTVAGDALTPPGGTQTASIQGSGVNGGLGRTDLLGGWTITSGTDSCQLFMTLTSWTGGYRASTKGCSDQLLKSISAWNLQGSEVILAGQGGAPLVRLASSGNNRFDGQVNGVAVSFYR